VRAGTVASLSCNISYLLAVILSPYMPSVSETILAQLNVNNQEHIINRQFQHVLDEQFVQFLPEGHHIGKVISVFLLTCYFLYDFYIILLCCMIIVLS